MKKSFYILNSVSWLVLLWLAAEPVANAITELWQFFIITLVFAYVGCLILTSARLATEEK